MGKNKRPRAGVGRAERLTGGKTGCLLFDVATGGWDTFHSVRLVRFWCGENHWRAQYYHVQVWDCHLQVRDYHLQALDCHWQVEDFHLQALDCHWQVEDCHLQALDCQLQARDCHLQALDCHWQV